MTTRRLFAVFLSVFASLWLVPAARAEGEPPPKPASEQPAPAAPAEPPATPEARREDVEPSTLTEARSALTEARAERDQAEADLAAANETIAALTLERAEAREQRDHALSQFAAEQEAASVATSRLATLTGIVKTALGLTDEQVATISDPATITAAVEQLAQRKAIDIAAGQGVPPVRTAVGASSEAEDIKADFAAAAAEPDPRKRGAMYAAASRRLTGTK
jgi:multidrug efflux pump subunit AcrA (membrane-fusion protein)